MRYTICLFVLLAAGCATDAERQQKEFEQQQMRAAQYRVGLENQCRAYGFKDDTAEFRDCLMRLDMANRQQWEAQRQMLLQQYINQQGIFRR